MNILFCKLKENHELHLTCNIKLNNLKNGTSGNSIVSKAVYYFDQDEKILNEELNKNISNGILKDKKMEKNFIISKRERYYKKTKDNKPLIYCFEITSVGDIPVKHIFTMGCSCIINKLENIVSNIKIDSDILEIVKSPTNMNAYDFIFYDEDDTLGNLLQTYIFNEKNIEYVAYVIPHPLDNKMLLRISINNTDNIDDYLKIINNILKKIIDYYNKIKLDYSKLV